MTSGIVCCFLKSDEALNDHLKNCKPLKLTRLLCNYFHGLLLEISKLYVHGRYLPKYDVKLTPLKMKSVVTTE